MSMAERVNKIKQTIFNEAIKHQRSPNSITLLAVSKQQSDSAMIEAFQAGIHHFGENYLQEALCKMEKLHHLPIHWHYIGAIQNNKTKLIAEHFEWVHSLCSFKHAESISKARPEALTPMNVCIQVNFDQEASKSGVNPEEVASLAKQIMTLPKLVLRGLMIIPKPLLNTEDQYQSFLRAHELLDTLNQNFNYHLDTLSMGMSNDYPAAIQAGSTIIRIGTAIFGERK